MRDKLQGVVAFVTALLVFAGFTALLLSCTPTAPPISDSGMNKEGVEMSITTYTYPNVEAVMNARTKFLEENNLVLQADPVNGWAAWSHNSTRCSIHTVKPSDVNDRTNLETMGHELAHCLYGNYHQ